MGQNNEPDAITWATSPPSGTYIVEPSAGDQANGFDPLQTPPHSWVNWAWNRFSSWVNYFSTFLGDASAAYVITGMTVVEIPNATQVTVNTGIAIAGGSQVEVTVAETVTLPNPAGTGTAPNPYYHVIYIDSTGTLQVATTPSSSSNFDEFEFLARASYQADNDKCELAIVQDEGQATFDTAHIRDIRVTSPIVTGVIEDGGIDSNNLRSEIVYPRIGAVGALSGADYVDVNFAFANYDFPELFSLPNVADNFRPGTAHIRIRVYESVGSASHVASGKTFDDISADQGPTNKIGVEVYENNPGTVVVAPGSWTANDGGFNFWEGEIDPTLVHSIRLYLPAGHTSADYVLEVATEHGVTATKTITLPAT